MPTATNIVTAPTANTSASAPDRAELRLVRRASAISTPSAPPSEKPDLSPPVADGSIRTLGLSVMASSRPGGRASLTVAETVSSTLDVNRFLNAAPSKARPVVPPINLKK